VSKTKISQKIFLAQFLEQLPKEGNISIKVEMVGQQQNLQAGTDGGKGRVVWDLMAWLDLLPEPRWDNALNDILSAVYRKFHGNCLQASRYLGRERRIFNYRGFPGTRGDARIAQDFTDGNAGKIVRKYISKRATEEKGGDHGFEHKD